MTTEVSIMNTQAVALAADSAVTIQTGDGNGQKIFNTVNKLFMLSKYHPVGVMIYGSAAYMGTPWETIIKVFRKSLGEDRKDCLEEYADSFIDYVSNIYSDSQELNSIEINHIKNTLNIFHNDLVAALEQSLKDIGTKEDATKLLARILNYQIDQVISSMSKELDGADSLDCMAENNASEKMQNNSGQVDVIWGQVFSQLPIPDDRKAKILDLSARAAGFGEFFSKSNSGIVIAGFGDKELFPVQVKCNIEGYLFGCLKHNARKVTKIGERQRAVVEPFAQRDVISNFMQGVDPSFFTSIKESFQFLSESGYPEVVEDVLKRNGVSDSVVDSVVSELVSRGKEHSVEIIQKLDLHSRKWHVDPIIEAVGFLPKEELAQLAESLVNLTSVRRKMSTNAETVGGPVDVAVISKGDGFIWIQRKHYFEPKLNDHFFKNYYKGE
ncbi:MAG: hypothetical protein V7752_00635 [Halopseudomonas sp.]